MKVQKKEIRNFRQLDVWIAARELVEDIYLLSSKMPVTEKFGLSSQMNRCVVSIPANIAEGSAKESSKDFSRYLHIARGSCYELETHLLLCSDLNFFEKKDLSLVLGKVQILQKRISAFIKYTIENP